MDNSEKKLTFAARLILENMKREDNPARKCGKRKLQLHFFEKALKLDPDNNDLKVGLGSCYVYGEGMIGNPQQTMKGIQQLLEVVKERFQQYAGTIGARNWRGDFKPVQQSH